MYIYIYTIHIYMYIYIYIYHHPLSRGGPPLRPLKKDSFFFFSFGLQLISSRTPYNGMAQPIHCCHTSSKALAKAWMGIWMEIGSTSLDFFSLAISSTPTQWSRTRDPGMHTASSNGFGKKHQNTWAQYVHLISYYICVEICWKWFQISKYFEFGNVWNMSHCQSMLWISETPEAFK